MRIQSGSARTSRFLLAALLVGMGGVSACSADEHHAPTASHSGSSPSANPTHTPGVNSVPPASNVGTPDSQTALSRCLAEHGVVIPRSGPPRAPSPGPRQRALEACAPFMGTGATLRLAEDPTDKFQRCLASHGVRIHGSDKVLELNLSEAATLNAIKNCASSPSLPSGG